MGICATPLAMPHCSSWRNPHGTVLGKLPKQYRAPSWSWESIEGPINYITLPSSAEPLIKVLCAHCSLGSQSPTGKVKDAVLCPPASILNLQLEIEETVAKRPGHGHMKLMLISARNTKFEVDEFWPDVPIGRTDTSVCKQGS
jgi:hypothetical protein